MNNTTKITGILNQYTSGLSALDLSQEYSCRYHIANDQYFRNLIKKALEAHNDQFRLNNATKLWEAINGNYLYVADNQRFSKIRDAMLTVFGKKVNSGSAYFSVDDKHSAWFPQFGNSEWENILSDDQKYWFERPKADADYDPDNKLRYTFAHEKDGYRFTGLFRFVELQDDRTRVYELVDDKVLLPVPVRPMLVCRITWMKRYEGITDDDQPVGGGSYVDANNDAYEKFNFYPQEDGLVHGFVETKYSRGHAADINYANSIHIENLDSSAKNSAKLDGVRIVFVSYNPNIGKTVVVGWYDNATVYRNRFKYNGLHTTMTCKAKDAHLIPIEERTFEIPKAGRENDFGIGQSNVWYIQNFDVAKDLENNINTYLDSLK